MEIIFGTIALPTFLEPPQEEDIWPSQVKLAAWEVAERSAAVREAAMSAVQQERFLVLARFMNIFPSIKSGEHSTPLFGLVGQRVQGSIRLKRKPQTFVTAWL